MKGDSHIFNIEIQGVNASFSFFPPHIIYIYISWTASSFTLIMEQVVVFWLVVTFHEQNLSPDRCAILGNLINNENTLWLVKCRQDSGVCG